MAENKDNNITSVMEALVKGAESVFTTKTVVGEATKIDDTIIIPLGCIVWNRCGRKLRSG